MNVNSRIARANFTGFASGAIASFTGLRESPIKVRSYINAIQSGSGDPSPDNIRPIIGRDSVTITANSVDHEINLGDTVYGGILDVTNGELKITRIKRGVSDLPFVQAARITSLGGNYFNADCNLNLYDIPQCKYFASEGASILASELFNMGTINNPYNSTLNCAFIFKLAENRIGVRIGFTDIQTLSEFNTIKDNIEICYELANPITVQLTPTQVEQIIGTNNIFSDTGNVEVYYVTI